MTIEAQQYLPEVSRQYMIEYIKNYGREDNPELSPQPVPIEKIFEAEIANNLWFGPDVDIVNFLFAKMYLGIFKIDPKTNAVIFCGSTD